MTRYMALLRTATESGPTRSGDTGVLSLLHGCGCWVRAEEGRPQGFETPGQARKSWKHCLGVLEKVVKMSPAALQCLLALPGSLKVDILRPGFLTKLT